jgi:phosphoserine aminotransferase
MARVHNFNAGPAVLPESVLQQVQAELVELPGVGMSIMEMSHRSKMFDAIVERTIHDIRALLGLPENYKVLFLQGGASLQFSMVPMNLLRAGQTADYILTGAWGQKAIQEAKKAGKINLAASTESENFSCVPQHSELQLTPDAAYLHFTSNETIGGVQFASEPQTDGVPLVCDASSDILSRPIDVEKYGLIYAGAQKNLGPSGVTLVIIRDDMIGDTPVNLPTMLDYKTHLKTNSMYNTPNTFGIYIIGLVCQWLEEQGGLSGMQKLNETKAGLLYEAIDAGDFYRGHAHVDSRSCMNVTFRLPSEELEREFLSEATARDMIGLAGHRDVGGLRASIYNASPLESVQALATFMHDFARRKG